MTRNIMLGLALMIGQFASAQVSTTFSTQKAAMDKLSNPTSVVDGRLDRLRNVEFAIGFDYKLNDNLVGDYIRFTDDCTFEIIDRANNTVVATVNAMEGTDFVERVGFSAQKTSDVRYQLMGKPGSQELIIEWDNVGFRKDEPMNNMRADYVNFQVKISEMNKAVTYTYGDMKVTSPQLYFGAAGPQVSYEPASEDLGYFLVNDSKSPRISFEQGNLENMPGGKMSYTFKPLARKLLSAKPSSENGYIGKTLDGKIYPNPTNNTFRLSLAPGFEDVHVIVRSPFGKVMFDGKIVTQRDFDLTGYDRGVYTVTLRTPEQVKVLKVMKQ